MLPDRVSNPGPLTYESGALPIALRGPAILDFRLVVSGAIQVHHDLLDFSFILYCFQFSLDVVPKWRVSTYEKK